VHEVGLGDDADQLALLGDGQTTELARLQQVGGPGRGGVGRDGLDVLLHEHLDRDVAGHHLEILPVRVTVTDPRFQDLAVRYETDQALLAVHDRQVADAPALHARARDRERVADAQRLDDGRHDLSDQSGRHLVTSRSTAKTGGWS